MAIKYKVIVIDKKNGKDHKTTYLTTNEKQKALDASKRFRNRGIRSHVEVVK